MRTIYDDLAECLAQAVGHLLGNRGPQGHWGDVRSTALAVWAFDQVVSGRNAQPANLLEVRTAVEDGRAWLTGQARREDGGFSWESEAWDTALALLALGSSARSSERVDQGVAWLQRIRDPKSGVWYDEVWETTLATVALLRAENTRERPSHDVNPWLEPVLRWFLGIPSKESGEFVSPHYSGFLAWILGETKVTRAATQIQATATFRAFQEKANAAVGFLLKTSKTPLQPWCSYTFANAYIAYGLSVLSRSERLDSHYAEVLINWMRTRQGRDGGFEDTEDTAIAIAALSAFLDAADEGRAAYDKMVRLMPKPPCRSHKCFLGYSGKSTGIALEIKESLVRRLPAVEIKDWRWDFQPGRVLFSEIEAVSRECHIAIFLVTKDDHLMQSEDKLINSPRDNVVFEVGYFAARLGMDHTLLVVEKGAKIPSDWGGILYIALRDRGNLAEVNLALIDAIGRVLPA